MVVPPGKTLRNRETVRGASRSAAGSLWRSLRPSPPPRNSLEFLTSHVWPWIVNYLRVALLPRLPLPTYQEPASSRPGVFAIPDACRIALAGDWGTGTDSAYEVAARIRSCEPEVTIHLGDVYYSGTARECREFFAGADDWPRGTLGTYALNSNHEMYSGGEGYFGVTLPAFGQKASYFALENAHWRIVALDTGYHSRTFPLLELLLPWLVHLPDPNVQWLEEVALGRPEDSRPVILLSHHQWFSAFDTEYRKVGRQLYPFLGRTALWFWGHEHRLAGYAPFGFDGKRVRGRCIGHGGMPIELGEPIKRPDRPLVFTDERDAGVLDGKPVGYCGFTLLRLDGPELRVEYRDEKGNRLLEERWRAGPGGVTGSVEGGELLARHRPLTELVT